MSLRIAAVQLKPRFGNVAYNAKKAFDIVSNLFSNSKRGPDMVVLPELALTGYNFGSPSHIWPFLENYTTALRAGGSFKQCPTLSWAVQVSKTFNCFTVVGYPEIFNAPSLNVIYNSSCLVSPAGAVIFNYRKSFLYSTDEVWGAQENPNGFEKFRLNLNKEYYHQLASGAEPEELAKQYESSFINAAMGICMDLSPYKFEAPFTKFEFSTFCFENDIDLILFPMAWLSPVAPSLIDKDNPESRKSHIKYFEQQFSDNLRVVNDSPQNDKEIPRIKVTDINTFDKNSVDTSTVDYWILRTVPLFNSILKLNMKLPFNDKTRHIVFCNRVGLENDVVYAGSSSIVTYGPENPVSAYIATQSTESTEFEAFQHLNSQNPSVHVLGSLPTGVEGVIQRDVTFSIL